MDQVIKPNQNTIHICQLEYQPIYFSLYTWSASLISPVTEFSILSNKSLIILKESGTTPLATPECTPSVKTSIDKLPTKKIHKFTQGSS